MIGYVTLGTNDLERAGRFYDALLAEIDAARMMEDDTFIAWAVSPQQPALSVIKPFNKQPAVAGNGNMTALLMASKEKVDAMHSKALALGGKDEGAPGARNDNFYAAYFRDLDDNKLCVFMMG